MKSSWAYNQECGGKPALSIPPQEREGELLLLSERGDGNYLHELELEVIQTRMVPIIPPYGKVACRMMWAVSSAVPSLREPHQKYQEMTMPSLLGHYAVFKILKGLKKKLRSVTLSFWRFNMKKSSLVASPHE